MVVARFLRLLGLLDPLVVPSLCCWSCCCFGQTSGSDRLLFWLVGLCGLAPLGQLWPSCGDAPCNKVASQKKRHEGARHIW